MLGSTCKIVFLTAGEEIFEEAAIFLIKHTQRLLFSENQEG